MPTRPRSWPMTVRPHGQRGNGRLQEGRKQPHLVHPNKKRKQLRTEGRLRGSVAGLLNRTVARRPKGEIEVPRTLQEAKGQAPSPDRISRKNPGIAPIQAEPVVVQKIGQRRKTPVVAGRKDRVPGRSARPADHQLHVGPSVNRKVCPIAALERTRGQTRRAPGLVRLVPLAVGRMVAEEGRALAVAVAVEKVVVDPL